MLALQPFEAFSRRKFYGRMIFYLVCIVKQIEEHGKSVFNISVLLFIISVGISGYIQIN